MALEKPYQKALVTDSPDGITGDDAVAEHHNKQERQLEAITDLLPAGFFSDGTGTNAGIGQGATAPTAAGANALAQGDSCVASGANGFAQGRSAVASGAYSMAQGYNITAPAHSFVQGQGHTIFAGTTHMSIQGESHTTVSGYFADNHIMMQGSGNTASGYSLSQGAGNSTPEAFCMAQGQNNSSGAGGFACFLQGYYNRNLWGSFALMQGWGNYCVASYSSVTVGEDNSILGDPSIAMVLVGADNQIFDYGISESSVVVGEDNYLQSPYSMVCVGKANYAYDSQGGWSTMLTGNSNVINSDARLGLIAGDSHTISADVVNFFAIGQSNKISQSNSGAHGGFCSTPSESQRALGSNRKSISADDANAIDGPAQASDIVKWVKTTASAWVTIATVVLEQDKSYSMSVNITARRMGADDEAASFYKDQVLAYIDNTASGAVVQGDAVALTLLSTAIGNIASLTAQVTASGDNVLVQVNGNASENHHWCCRVSMVEVYSAGA